MNYAKPPNRPKATLQHIEGYLRERGWRDEARREKIYMLGVRGYYANTFGKPRVNDRVFYDDALFVVENPNTVWAYNFNCDPSVYRKGVATLKAEEKYNVVKWRHRGRYPALQITRDILHRDGTTQLSIGRHGINFHYDAEHYSKDSLGCQTLPRSQWDAFIKLAYGLMDKHKVTNFTYYLIENKG